MATKTISITEEAYERLRTRKKERESFSDIINRITNKPNILEFAGLLNDSEANKLMCNIEEARNLSRKRSERLLK